MRRVVVLCAMVAGLGLAQAGSAWACRFMDHSCRRCYSPRVSTCMPVTCQPATCLPVTCQPVTCLPQTCRPATCMPSDLPTGHVHARGLRAGRDGRGVRRGDSRADGRADGG